MISKVLMGAIAVLGAALAFQSHRVDNLRSELTIETSELQSCGERLLNLQEDIESDAQATSLIDNLNDIPAHWLRME
jgi:hypothetical protein